MISAHDAKITSEQYSFDKLELNQLETDVFKACTQGYAGLVCEANISDKNISALKELGYAVHPWEYQVRDASRWFSKWEKAIKWEISWDKGKIKV